CSTGATCGLPPTRARPASPTTASAGRDDGTARLATRREARIRPRGRRRRARRDRARDRRDRGRDPRDHRRAGRVSPEADGYMGRPIEVYKFRTMREATDANGRSLPDAERLTPLGRFLRATSLDELPQLVNVLRGELSLVGPRPLLVQYLERY